VNFIFQHRASQRVNVVPVQAILALSSSASLISWQKTIIFYPAKKQAPVLAGACCEIIHLQT
jgi:hypothetical protein